MMSADQVHPDFRQRIWAAVQDRFDREQRSARMWIPDTSGFAVTNSIDGGACVAAIRHLLERAQLRSASHAVKGVRLVVD